jgi:hypothetical protein
MAESVVFHDSITAGTMCAIAVELTESSLSEGVGAHKVLTTEAESDTLDVRNDTAQKESVYGD